jgi:lipoprotein-anchoring transpeptidase ErfK/SrfK
LIASAIAFPNARVVWETVNFALSVSPGTIVINVKERTLFFVVSEGAAIRYPIAVPKHGKEWSGTAAVNGKYAYPDWAPPPSVKVDHPELPDFIRGGSPNNPMRSRAITLD